MQLANITLALGGDRGQTIQKFGVTPAEVAVLREIHGEASVFDVQPLDEDAERSNREERTRLLEIYGKPPGSRELSAVEALFPGAAARVFENFDELELDESFYKATDRARPKKAQKPKEREDEPEPEPDEDEPEPDEDEPSVPKVPPPKPKPRPRPAAARKTVAKKSSKPLFK